MHYSPILIALASAYLARADVSLGDLPDCSTTPLENGIGATKCSITDFACICHASSFIDTVAPQVAAACSAADEATFISVAEGLCKTAGVTITIPTSGGSPPAAPAKSVPATSMEAPASTPAASSVASSNMPTSTAPYPIGNGSAAANTTNTTAMAFEGAAAPGYGMGAANAAMVAAMAVGAYFL